MKVSLKQMSTQTITANKKEWKWKRFDFIGLGDNNIKCGSKIIKLYLLSEYKLLQRDEETCGNINAITEDNGKGCTCCQSILTLPSLTT